MSIRDVEPTELPETGGPGTPPPPPPWYKESAAQAALVLVNYGDMINGIPAIKQESFNTIDEAIQFASPLVNSYQILYIEYQGLKLGVNI